MNKKTANLLGMIALLCWGLNVAVTRHITEVHQLGMPGLSFLTAGLLLIAFDLIRGRGLPWASNASPKFWILGGSSFVLYLACYVLALSWAKTDAIVLPLGLVNYFWPALILALMPAFFPAQVRWGVLLLGLALCVAGVGMALLWGLNLATMATEFVANWQAFLLMILAAFLWAFYSNAACKWGGTANGTGWFMATAGLILTLLWWSGGKPLGFSADMTAPFLLHALVVNAAAYMFWDTGVRKGTLLWLGMLANFLPLLSVLFGAVYLGNPVTIGLWLGGGLVVGGAMLCRKGLAVCHD